MTSFNRAGATWAGGDYGLITGILRNEWAFDGIVMTDNANTGVFMDGYQMTEAGADVKLTAFRHLQDTILTRVILQLTTMQDRQCTVYFTRSQTARA